MKTADIRDLARALAIGGARLGARLQPGRRNPMITIGARRIAQAARIRDRVWRGKNVPPLMPSSDERVARASCSRE
jgi:hypothetical protein